MMLRPIVAALIAWALVSPAIIARVWAAPAVVRVAQGPTPQPGTAPPPPTPLPGVGPVAQPPPPEAVPSPTRPALASPEPAAPPGTTLVRYSGQLLDYRAGYAYFTTGDGFRVAPDVRIVDAKTGAPVTRTPRVKDFARATFDAQGAIVELALSSSRLPTEASYEKIKGYAVALSPATSNPDLERVPANAVNGVAPTGKAVTVTFVVEVPPTTPFGDSVYLATDASQWNPQAIRLDRIDALHYRVTREFASGTQFLYRYTRGTWQTEELAQNGIEGDPRRFVVRETNAQRRNDIIYNWADAQNGAPQAGPQSIPTPFNPRPFAFPTPLRPLPSPGR